MEDGSFRRCGLVVLVDTQTLDSGDKLTQLNLSLRSLWASTTVIIKPWAGRIARTDEGNFVMSAIPYIADRVGQGIRRLPQLLKIQVHLMSMHRSGRIVSNRPNAPPNPSMPVMTSMEVCSYLRAVAEAATAQDATNLWQPGPALTPLKRLQPKKTHRGGSQGRGHPKGTRGGRGGNYGRGRGGHGGGRGGQGGLGGRGGRVDAVVLQLLTQAYTTIPGSEWPKNIFFPSSGQI